MPESDAAPHLGEHELPSLFRVADATATAAQRRYLNLIRLQLAMLFVGSVAGLLGQVTDITSLAFIGVGAYIVLVIVRVNLKVSSTDRVWYENRQIAESVKSLAWRYAVAAAPFAFDSEDEPDLVLSERIADLLGDASHVPLPDPRMGTEQITDAMRALRARALEERVAIYSSDRLERQLQWYASRAKQHSTMAGRLDTAMLGASGMAVFFGFCQALGLIDANLLGLAGIIAAIVATWTATTHYGKQAADYSVAAHQLTLVRTMIGHQDSEPKWSMFVNDAEDGISREHTSWRVTRAQR